MEGWAIRGAALHRAAGLCTGAFHFEGPVSYSSAPTATHTGAVLALPSRLPTPARFTFRLRSTCEVWNRQP